MWTDDVVARLTDLWNAGKSASEISKALGEGITRNAVIGKAHRLGLKARPSPIVRDQGATILTLNDRMCKWPVGHPGEAGFHFCGKKAQGGMPYCVDHSQQAYQPGTSMQEMERRRKSHYR